MADASMRVLTVKEPSATLIVKHGKNIENRPQNIAGNYRGPVAIHVALRAMPANDPAWQTAAAVGMSIDRRTHHPGRIIGVVDLVDVTHCTGDPDDAAGESSPGSSRPQTPTGWGEADCWHLHLDNPHVLDKPIAYTGSLALRRLDPGVTVQILAQLAEAGAAPRARARLVDG